MKNSEIILSIILIAVLLGFIQALFAITLTALINNEYMFGTNYQYNSSFSIQLGHSYFEKLYLGFLLNFEKFNIGYSFVVPKYTELGTSQRILIGINKDSFNLKL